MEPDLANAWTDLPHAVGKPVASALLREQPEDFLVEEIQAEPWSGRGEHLLLWVEKRDANSEWLAGQLARAFEVPRRDVGLAGLKDRRAVTRQWFSLPVPSGAQQPTDAQIGPGVHLLDCARHHRKLRRGALLGNRFAIRLRQLRGDRVWIEERLQQLATEGFPNYFGLQRFGRNGSNLAGAQRLFRDRRYRPNPALRGLLISAARSWLFNRVLALRVQRGDWCGLLDGDLLLHQAANELAPAPEPLTEAQAARLDAGGWLHPTGPMWGRDRQDLAGAARQLEAEVLAAHASWRDGLQRLGANHDRRALRVIPRGLEFEWAGVDDIWLRFELPAGAYATALLRELVEVVEPASEGETSGSETPA